MQCPDQDPSRLQQPIVLSFSVSWRGYLGNLGSDIRRHGMCLPELLEWDLRGAVSLHWPADGL